jgi:hypothetical protein
VLFDENVCIVSMRQAVADLAALRRQLDEAQVGTGAVKAGV